MNHLRSLTIASFFASAVLCAPAQQAVATRVDPRVELVTAVARLAGFGEFDMPNSRSPYAHEIEQRFGPLREHAAVTKLKELRQKNGVSFDAIASLAVHLDGVEKLGELTPFDKAERLDARWTAAGAREFLVQLRDFAAQSKAVEFFAAHRAFYAEVAKRLSERLSDSRAIPWFDAFFGARPGAKYTAVAGLLCGGGNFGVGVRFTDGRPEEITPVFGCWTWDEHGVPIFGEQYLPLFVHELCHSYTNPFVDRFAKELEEPLARIHASCADAMRRQSYGTWQTMAYESLVRASVVRCRLATEGKPAAEQQAREEVGHHFTWVPALAALLGDYESDRTKYAKFDDFMPRVVEFFVSFANTVPKDSDRPHVLSIEPANGASDVDPALAKLVIRFDRAMLDQSWSLVGSKTDLPEITGQLAYDQGRTTLTVPIKMAPGRTYRFALNSDEHSAFKSADGVALAPLAVTFTTRG